ncbi:MAG: hypothetical protein R3E32_28345 [Chitinophagales bacterium]
MKKGLKLISAIYRLKSQMISLVELSLSTNYTLIATGIILFSFGLSLYHVTVMPISYDEALTYLNFTKKGFLTSISYYPAPNNHVLHSLLTRIFVGFPFSQHINLRLPNLIFSILTSIIFYLSFTKLFKQKTALLLLTVFCFLFPVQYYSYMSRGYMLVLFAFTICFYSTIRLISTPIVESKNHTKYFVSLSLGAVVGFFTMPSFLYPYFTCVLLIFVMFITKKNIKGISYLTVSCLLTSLVVLILYTPIFIVSGIDAIINNRFVVPISRVQVLEGLLGHFNSTSIFLFSIPLQVFLFVLFIMCFVARKTKMVIIPMCFFLIVPFILLLHSVIPFPRTWVYLIVPFLYLIGLTIENFQVDKKLSIKSIGFFSIIIILFSIFNFNKKVNRRESFSFKVIKIADYLVDQKAKHIYVNHPLININLTFIFEEKNIDIPITYSRKDIDNSELKMIKSCCDFAITPYKPNRKSNLKHIKRWSEDTHLSKVK